MMGMRLRLVSLFCLFLLLLAEPFFAKKDSVGEGRPQASLEGESLSDAGTTDSAGTDEGRHTGTENGALAADTLTARGGGLEATIPVGVDTDVKNPRDEGVEKRATNQGNRKRRNRLLADKRLYLPLAVVLVLLAGAVAFKLMRPAVPVGPVPHSSRARLDAVKDLLPVAKRLASAIGTPEAQGFVDDVEKEMASSELEAAGVTESSKLKSCLDAALKALRALHNASLKHAEKLHLQQQWVETINLLEPISQEIREAIAGWDADGAEKTAQPYERTYSSVLEFAKLLHRRCEKMYEGLVAGPGFEDENDGDLLLSSSLVIEALQNAEKHGKHTAEHASSLWIGTFEASQALCLAKTEEVLADTRTELELYRVQAAAARRASAARTPKDSASSDQQSAATSEDSASSTDAEALLTKLEKNLSQVEETVKNFEKGIESLRKTKSLTDLKRLMAEASGFQDHAQSLLVDCANIKEKLLLPNELDESERKSLVEMADKAIKTINAAHESLQGFRAKLPSVANELSRYLNVDAVDYLLRNVQVAAEEAEGCIDNANEWRAQAEAIKELRNGVQETLWAAVNVRTAIGTQARAKLCLLRYNLFKFLEKDMASLVAAAHMNTVHLSLTAKEDYEQVKKQFDGARKAAKDAQAVPDAAEAVVRVREALHAMQDIVFAIPDKGPSPEKETLVR